MKSFSGAALWIYLLAIPAHSGRFDPNSVQDFQILYWVWAFYIKTHSDLALVTKNFKLGFISKISTPKNVSKKICVLQVLEIPQKALETCSFYQNLNFFENFFFTFFNYLMLQFFVKYMMPVLTLCWHWGTSLYKKSKSLNEFGSQIPLCSSRFTDYWRTAGGRDFHGSYCY